MNRRFRICTSEFLPPVVNYKVSTKKELLLLTTALVHNGDIIRVLRAGYQDVTVPDMSALLALTTDMIGLGDIVKVNENGKYYVVIDTDMIGSILAFSEVTEMELTSNGKYLYYRVIDETKLGTGSTTLDEAFERVYRYELRDDDTIYFVYDKMQIFLGCVLYNDPFCIVENLSEDPVEGMIYIKYNGDVYTFIDEHHLLVAQIHDLETASISTMLQITDREAEEGDIVYVTSEDKYFKIIDRKKLGTMDAFEEDFERDLLMKAGTNYFMKAEYRYLDFQSRCLELPFQNGTYKLTVDAAANLQIDEDTVIKFNPDNNRFEIEGNTSADDTSNALVGYTGSRTNTVKTTVENGSIRADVRVSDKENNLIKIFGNGLYASLGNIVETEEFLRLVNMYNQYKNSVSVLMQEIRDKMDEGYDLTGDTILERIHDSLVDYEPTIDDLLANYDDIILKLGNIRQATVEYTDSEINSAKNEIIDYITNITEAWDSYDYTGNDSSAESSMMSESELAVQASVLEELRTKFMIYRKGEVDPVGTSIDFNMYLIVDGVVGGESSDIYIIPNSIEVISEAGSAVGKSYITVTHEKKDYANRYYYKETTQIPHYKESIIGQNYTLWDENSEIELNDNARVVIVECNAAREAIAFGKFKAVVRTSEPEELKLLRIVSVEGSISGYTKLIVSPELEEGNKYMYGLTDRVPAYNSIVLDNFVDWDGESEIAIDAYDKQLVSLVECTWNNKAKKFGCFPVDLSENMLKLLAAYSSYGSLPMQTVVTVDAIVPNDHYLFYKIGDNKDIPIENAHISSIDGWTSWDKTVPNTVLTMSNFTSKIVLVETDASDKATKGVVVSLKINNDMTVNAQYNPYRENIISIVNKTDNCDVYYKVVSDSTEAIDHLYYNDYAGDYDQAELFDNTFNVSEIESELYRIAVVETHKDTRRVIRFGVVNVVIEYVDALDFSIDEKKIETDTSDPYNPVSTEYVILDINDPDIADRTYYYQLMQYADTSRYPVGSMFDSDSGYVLYDKTSDSTNYLNSVVIADADESSIVAIKLVAVDDETSEIVASSNIELT